ncbi:hypothetical protein [Microbacterium amylolyticum]|uniref:Cell division protein FtsL n=1 Tax=Microbacterium amylolyticum TaxID=936337 RepID=A0ABS4ZFG0_9MICO|nr:hypothetical protein [Microbacterium amylolyticum]MBP2435999.1 hypothetical protein [Microbacterium amylolyticum]
MSIADIDLFPFDDPQPREPGRVRRLAAVEAPQKQRKPRLGYALIAVAGAALIAVAQLGLSIMTAQGSYELATLESEQRQLTLDQQQLSDDIAGLGSPQYLAANASALGMVIDSSPSYLRLSDAQVLGAGTPSGDRSTVNVHAGNAAGNALIDSRPLATDQQQTFGNVAEPAPLPVDLPEAPPVVDGLPTPSTH